MTDNATIRLSIRHLMRRTLILATVLVAGMLYAGTCCGEEIGVDDRSTTTFVGSLVSGEPGRLAVSLQQEYPPAGANGSVEKSVRGGYGWEQGFLLSDFDGYAYAFAVYNDGGGDALYAGGNFNIAGGVTVNNIAKWDGTQWSGLSGPSGVGMSGSVYALAVYDDGSGDALYAGGFFDTAGGVTVNNIAKWDGTQWSVLSGPSGTGMNNPVDVLTVFDSGRGDALYAGGSFSTAGGVTGNYVAKWDGTQWSALSGPSGTGMSGRVEALAVFDDGSGDALYAGGWFTTAGGVTVNKIAKWNGTQWSALSGTGMSGNVEALAVYDDGSGDALYAGGNFSTAGGVSVKNIAKWNGTLWSALSGPSGTGMDDYVLALAVYDGGSGDALYASGRFTSAGGLVVNRLAKWDGSQWLVLPGPTGNGMNTSVLAFAVYNDGSGDALYAAGWFTVAGGVSAPRIAKWDGTQWSAFSGPTGGDLISVQTLAVYDDGGGDALYVGGDFSTVDGIFVSRIAKWDGTQWSALYGPAAFGTNGDVFALATYDDGSGDALYAGGDFNTAGGVTVNGIAKWNGTQWSALSGPSGTGMGYMVDSLAVYDDGGGDALYAGGGFNTAGGVTVNGIAKWDGTQWSALSGPSGTGMNDRVYALATTDDGSGNALFAGGNFYTAGGVASSRIARWRRGPVLFSDGFESSDTSAWSITVP